MVRGYGHKNFGWTIFVLCLFFCLVARADDRLRVGVINGLTGPWAAYGLAYKTGLELARVESRVHFVFEDDQFLPARTVTAFQKLLQNDSIDVVMVGDDATVQAIAPLAARRGIPLVAWAGASGALSNNPAAFRIWDTVEPEITVMESLLRSAAPHHVKVITSNHPYAVAFGRAICGRLQSRCQSLDELGTEPDDLKPTILRSRAAGVDAFLLCLNPGSNGLFARQQREVHGTTPIFGCNFFESSIDRDTARGAFEGVRFVAPAVSESFREQYIARTGGTSHLISAAVHHDAALLLAQVAEFSGDRKGKLIDALMQVENIKGALGPLRPVVDGTDKHLRLNMSAYRVQGGEILRDATP